MRAFQVVGGTEAIPSGLPRFAVWPELLNPEDSSAKTELVGALKRARAQEGTLTPHRPGCQLVAAPRESGEVGTGHCSNGELPGSGVGHVGHFIEGKHRRMLRRCRWKHRSELEKLS